MRMARPEKVDKVKDISGRFENSEAALLTEYRGLRVSEIAEVRGALRDADAEYKVYKNTLARIAVRDVGLEELVGMLEGPTAIAFVRGDAAAAAKALDDAAKKYPVLVVKGGVLNGRVIDAAQANELARLEPREVQLARVAMLMNAPAQRVVNAFAALLRDLGSMLAQVVTKKESGELPAGTAETTAPQTAPQEVQDENPAPEAEPDRDEANPQTDTSKEE
jgi:large subunit ribosomal protein L10